MIKRPLHPQFTPKVLAGIKTTTIRDNSWPCETPIMLYNWSHAPYRSKQIDVAAVIVWHTGPIKITRREDGGMLYNYECHDPAERIHLTEGFETRADMDDWFRHLVKPGQTITKQLMRFRLATPEEITP